MRKHRTIDGDYVLPQFPINCILSLPPVCVHPALWASIESGMPAQLLNFYLFEAGSHSVTKSSLELEILLPVAFQVAGTMDLHHHAQLQL